MWMQESHAFNFFSPVMSYDLVREYSPSRAPIIEIVNLEYRRIHSSFFVFHNIPIKKLF